MLIVIMGRILCLNVEKPDDGSQLSLMLKIRMRRGARTITGTPIPIWEKSSMVSLTPLFFVRKIVTEAKKARKNAIKNEIIPSVKEVISGFLIRVIMSGYSGCEIEGPKSRVTIFFKVTRY